MHKQQSRFLPFIAMLIALAVAGCNNDTGETTLAGVGHDHEHDHEHGHEHEHGEHQAVAGRLIYTSANGTNSYAYVYDLAEEQRVGKFALTYPVYARYAPVYRSPGGRYAVIVQRANNHAQIVDSGLEAHDGHLHKEVPQLLLSTLTGPLPTHYKLHGDQAVLFFDGTTGVSSKFQLLTEQSIGNGTFVAQQVINSAHHGIAVPLGGVVLASYAEKGVAAGVTLYQLHGNHFHNLGRIDVACPDLHGAGVNNAGYVVFGCDDGLLVVPPEAYDPGTTPNATEAFKIAFDQRISGLVGHHELPILFGAGSYDLVNDQYFYKKLYVVNPLSRTITPLNWSGGDTDAEGNPISAYLEGLALGPAGEHFVVLGENGFLYVLEAKNRELIAQIEVLQSVKKSVSPALAFNADGSKLYIADPAGEEINIVDMEELALVGDPIELNFAPVGLIWAGPRAEHGHHHEEEHSDKHSHEHNHGGHEHGHEHGDEHEHGHQHAH